MISIDAYDVHTIYYALIFLSSSMVRKLSYLYSMIVMTLASESTNVLSNYLKSVNKRNGYYICQTFPNRNESRRKNDYLREDNEYIDVNVLVFIKQSYCEIWEMVQIIRNLVYFSFPIGLSSDVFVLLFHSYWFFLYIFLAWSNVIYLIFPLLNITMNMGYIIFLAYNCNKAVESVSHSIIIFGGSIFHTNEKSNTW